jgi:hypothetical protein
MTGELEQCETLAAIRKHDGQRAAVVGRYEQADVRKRKEGNPVYRGHASIRLRDDTGVFLEPTWADDAIRSEAERERFEGWRVRVVGTVHEEPPDPPEPVAYIVAPCVSPVERIEPVE